MVELLNVWRSNSAVDRSSAPADRRAARRTGEPAGDATPREADPHRRRTRSAGGWRSATTVGNRSGAGAGSGRRRASAACGPAFG
ncbi:hypothetical protein GJ633_13310 [Halorubrum sp. CBA1125]|uniref:hypothetical protein n=1 Tax=Halorubrum sp. CBA1125 TaxID=2668072 RepID=UPI0012E7DCAE|nr:hypothetical protein [Halorubrum sp. CBA1125]MUW15499.1 hypothetical protein [Halorubrum sp. CBA1125]